MSGYIPGVDIQTVRREAEVRGWHLVYCQNNQRLCPAAVSNAAVHLLLCVFASVQKLSAQPVANSRIVGLATFLADLTWSTNQISSPPMHLVGCTSRLPAGPSVDNNSSIKGLRKENSGALSPSFSDKMVRTEDIVAKLAKLSCSALDKTPTNRKKTIYMSMLMWWMDCT